MATCSKLTVGYSSNLLKTTHVFFIAGAHIKTNTNSLKKQQQESLSAFTVMFGGFWVRSELACVFLPNHWSRPLGAQKKS